MFRGNPYAAERHSGGLYGVNTKISFRISGKDFN